MKSWNELARNARDAAPPSDVDLRAAIRAEITSSSTRNAVPDLIDNLAGLIRVPWFQAGLATCAVIAFIACRDGFDIVNELAFIWQLQGPAINGI
ncbi:MAG: hypothetical protein R3F13_20975 [Prosthecobacter sp.]